MMTVIFTSLPTPSSIVALPLTYDPPPVTYDPPPTDQLKCCGAHGASDYPKLSIPKSCTESFGNVLTVSHS